MGKYIIELEEPEMFDDRKFYTCSQMPWWAVSENIVENLTPYTEPDTEKVREEAYEDGYKTAKVQCNIQAEKDLREVGERHYQKGYQDATAKISSDEQAIAEKAYQSGLSDAWEAARKIANMPYGEEEKAFGSGGWSFIDKHTASEAIEKIRQYEQEKDRQARIEYNFDEIKDVLETTVKECNVSLDEIAAVLQKMKEEL